MEDLYLSEWGYLDPFTERDYLRETWFASGLEVRYVWAFDKYDFSECEIRRRLREVGYIGEDEVLSHERILFPLPTEIFAFLHAVLPQFPENAINVLVELIYDRWHTFNVRKYLPKVELRENGFDLFGPLVTDNENREEFVYGGIWEIQHVWNPGKIAILRSIGFLGKNEEPTHERILFPTKKEIKLFISEILPDFPLAVAGDISEFVHQKMHTFSVRDYLPTVNILKSAPKEEFERIS